eukprot:EG_transcript_27304
MLPWPFLPRPAHTRLAAASRAWGKQLRRYATPQPAERTHFRPRLTVLLLGLGGVVATYRWTQLRVQTQLQEEGLTRANIVALLAKQPGLVVDKAGKPVDVAAALAGKTLGLYFSAAWCPPCQTFTPMLRSFYKITNQEFATLEVVYVPCDRSQEEQQRYVDAMHDLWLHVPFKEQETLLALKKACHCWAGEADRDALGTKDRQYGVPCFILFTPDGKRFDPDGVNFVQTWHMS